MTNEQATLIPFSPPPLLLFLIFSVGLPFSCSPPNLPPWAERGGATVARPSTSTVGCTFIGESAGHRSIWMLAHGQRWKHLKHFHRFQVKHLGQREATRPVDESLEMRVPSPSDCKWIFIHSTSENPPICSRRCWIWWSTFPQIFKVEKSANAHHVYVAANHTLLQLATIPMPIKVHTRPLSIKMFR